MQQDLIHSDVGMLEAFIYSKKKIENFTVELYVLCVLNMYAKFCVKQMLFYN